VITAEIVITGCRSRSINGLSSGLARAKRTIESALDQTLRAKSRGIACFELGTALRTERHNPALISNSTSGPR
jgi:hypothetical protein